MPHFQIGHLVMSRMDSTCYGPILDILSKEGGSQFYKVLWPHPAGPTNVMEEDLLPYNDGNDPKRDFLKSEFSGFEDFLRLITVKRLSKSKPIKNTLYAFNASRTRFFPYQFKPLMKFLDSEKYRLLICDEVGLGKTIEAGLILTEFKARFNSNKILIVCPSALQLKWKNELKQRFDEDFVIYKKNSFLEKLEEYEKAPEPTSLNGIISFESIRHDQVLQRIKEVSLVLNLVIIDEAHHMRNSGRNIWKAGTLLSEGADAMVMLTATPVQLGRENLFTLLQILDKQEFPEKSSAEERFVINENIVMAQNCIAAIPPRIGEALKYMQNAGCHNIIVNNPYYLPSLNSLKRISDGVQEEDAEQKAIVQLNAQRNLSSLNLISHIYTRTKRRQVHEDFTQREANAIIIEFTQREKEFYVAVTSYVKALSVAKGHCSVVEKWLLNMPQRQMASSIPAMVRYYKSTLGRWKGYAEDVNSEDDIDEQFNQLLESEDVDARDIKDEKNISVEEARSKVLGIVNTWDENIPDSKFEAFYEAIGKIKRAEGKAVKILVFSFFKGTLRYLEEKLRAVGIGVVTISGDVKSDERAVLIERFRNDEKTEILLSSKVGSEGLDFQFCHIMFNYDLPWNPMEVEQRIGRLDRIGQESSKISIYHFWVKGTVEERILKRLYERIGIFERSIGELETVLGEISKQLEYELFTKDLTEEEEQAILNRKLMVLEDRKQELEHIESDAAKFIGTDAFFAQEVERVKNNKLYITPDQIKNLLEYFIKTQAPNTRLSYDIQKQVGRIIPGNDLVSIMAKTEHLKEYSSISSFGIKDRAITFDGDTAFKNPHLDFINLLHPLIKTVVDYYGALKNHSKECFYVCLQTDELPTGFYFFFTYMMNIKAAKEEYVLRIVLLDGYCKEACSSVKAERIFGEILEKGSTLETPAPEFECADMEQVYKKAESVIGCSIAQKKAEMMTTNQLFVDRRINAVASSYDRILNQRRERLKNEKQKKNSDDRIIRMLLGDIRNREAEKKHDIDVLESRRDVSVSSTLLCLGCLEIRNNEGV